MGTEIVRDVLVIKTRLSVNLVAPTIEQLVSRLQRSHLQLMDVVLDDLKFFSAPKRALAALENHRLEAERHDPQWFNNPQNYKAITNRAVEVSEELFETLADPTVWELETGPDEQIAERMLAVAMFCASAAQHRTATGLLQLAVKRSPPPSNPEMSRALGILGQHSCTPGERRRLEACQLILSGGALQPWPPTLVQLASFEQSQPPSTTPTPVERGFLELARSLVSPNYFEAGADVLVWKGLGWGRARLKGSRTDSEGRVAYDALLGGFDLKKNLKPHHVLSVHDEGAGAILLAAAQAGQTALVDALLAAGVSVFAADASASTSVCAPLNQRALLLSARVHV